MSDSKEFIPALGYNWLTAYYDLTIKLTMPEKRFRGRLIDQLDPHPKEEILEFGYGTGVNLLMPAKKNRKRTTRDWTLIPRFKRLLFPG